MKDAHSKRSVGGHLLRADDDEENGLLQALAICSRTVRMHYELRLVQSTKCSREPFGPSVQLRSGRFVSWSTRKKGQLLCYSAVVCISQFDKKVVFQLFRFNFSLPLVLVALHCCSPSGVRWESFGVWLESVCSAGSLLIAVRLSEHCWPLALRFKPH